MSSVAVVIPLYNHEQYIGRAIESVRTQTRPVEKIVVVDDGSSDDSVEVVRAINDPRIELTLQANAGAHNAINRGVERARDCEFVAILNSDDFFEPERVEKCLGFLQEKPELDVACTNLRLIGEDDLELPLSAPRAKWFDAVWSLQDADLTLPEWLGIANFIGTTSNVFARTEYLLAHPFRDYRYTHDYFFFILCALGNRLGILPEKLLNYRAHAANTVSEKPDALRCEVLRLNLDLMRELSPRLAESQELRRSFAAYHRTAWSSVSSFRGDLFIFLIARLVASNPDLQLDDLNVQNFPELGKIPNNELIKQHLGKLPLGPNSGLAGKCEQLKAEVKQTKSELAQFKARASGSAWLRLGRKLGIKSARITDRT